MRRPRTASQAATGLLILAVAVLVVLLAVPAGADTLSNISPVSPLSAGGWMGRYPISHYQIDQYFPAISISLFGGLDVSGLMPMIAYATAQVIWLITAFVANTVITVFQFAFHLNLLTGEGETGGALVPISQAIHNVYTHTFGQPWLVAAVAAVGMWAMWKALVQRHYTQTTAALATSLIYCVVALGIVAHPAQTITPLSDFSNETSQAFLSLISKGNVSEGAAAEKASSDELFQTLVVNPWTVLEFGGIEHCVDAAGHSVAVQPLSHNTEENTRLNGQLEETSELDAEGKRCINNREKYAPHFLAYPYQSPGRNAEYEALKAGEDSKLPPSDPAKSNSSYPLGAADKPAAEAAGKGNQYERLLLSILIFAGELGVWVLLGVLAAGVILAQILLLVLLMIAPVVLPIAAFPGRGHAFFIGWCQRLLGYLARKAIYSLILAILLAVAQALLDATSSLGWLMSFLLYAAFMWTVLLQRRQLTSGLMATITGTPAAEERGLSRLQGLFDVAVLTGLAGLRRNASQEKTHNEQPKPKSGEQPRRAGATTATSKLSRPATTAKTSQSSRPAKRTSIGATPRALGSSTPTTPAPPVTPSGPSAAPVKGPRTDLRPSVDSAGPSRQKPGQVTPSSRAPSVASATATGKEPPRSAISTPSAHRVPRKPSATTKTSKPLRPAVLTSTLLPPPTDSAVRRAAARQPLPARPIRQTSASTPTTTAPKAATNTTTTAVPGQADRPKETKR